MHGQQNIKKKIALYICVLHINFTANYSHFPQQCKLVGLTNGVGMFSLWGMNWSFICNLYWRQFSKRFALLMHCIHAVRSVGLSFGVIISLDHAAGTRTELAAPSYPLAEPDSYYVPGVWTLFEQVHAYAFLNLQCHGRTFSHAIANGSLFRLRSNGVVISFCRIAWSQLKEKRVVDGKQCNNTRYVLPQIEYVIGILIHRGVSFWNYLVVFFFFCQCEEHVYKITSSKTWSVDSASDTQRACKWGSSPKMF